MSDNSDNDAAPRTSSRKRRHVDDDQDAEQVQDEAPQGSDVDEVEEVEEEDAQQGAGEEEDEDNIDDLKPDMFNGNQQERDVDDYLPGAIVRVKLSHFVTYDAVEFHPGPYLNMIIGPNGTGKSTVVCAIALGLGWKPSVLGRAKDVAAYVKQGYDDGWIEIELKGHFQKGEKNVVIRRLITKKANKSQWLLNGKSATQKDVINVVASLNIQIENLCSFLPQDKVAEFARMQPSELLKETQRATGGQRLTRWHERLIQLGKTDREITAKLEKDRSEIANLQERNEVLQRDVRRYEERRRIETAVEVLKIRIPFAKYAQSKERYDRLKVVRNERKAELDIMKRSQRPTEDKLEKLTEYKDKVEARRKSVLMTMEKDTKSLKKRADEAAKQDNTFSELVEKLDGVKATETARVEHIKSLQASIEKLQASLGDEPQSQDTSTIDGELRQIREQIRRLDQQKQEIVTAEQDLASDSKALHNEKTEIGRKLQKEDNVKDLRLRILQHGDPAAYEAVLWLRNNQNKFQQKVHEPVMLELSIKDQKHVRAIESCIAWRIQRTFVCQTRADYDLFTSELIDRKKLRLNVTELEGKKSLEEFQRPCSAEQLRQFGFSAVALDLVDGPEAVLRYLCDSAQLHQVPIAANERDVNAEEVERSRLFKRFVTGNNSHTITYSAYGSKSAQTMSRGIKAPRTFIQQAGDHREKTRLDTRMAEVAEKLRDNEANAGTLQRDLKKLKTQYEPLLQRKADLEAEKKKIAGARAVWEKKKVDLQTKRRALKKEASQPTSEAETKRLNKAILEVVAKHSAAAQDVKALVMEQVKNRRLFDMAQLELCQHEGKLQAMKALLLEQTQECKALEKALNDAAAALQRAKAAATAAHAQAQNFIESAAPESVAEAQRINADEANLTVSDLEDALSNEQAKLDMVTGVSESVIAAYNRRKKEIEALDASITEQAAAKAAIDTKLESTRAKWIPELEKVVSAVSEKFSEAFERIGCAGEVRISQNADYDRWGIDILVKFRDNEQLQLLTGQRQSGGERSLSTILYLMSLTELSQSPFSLVDEINQGMDQRAERAVHDQMVEVTCKETASQYFLITPKLLPDLRFHPRMKVLIINNGEWLPERFSFEMYIERIKKRRRLMNGASQPVPSAA